MELLLPCSVQVFLLLKELTVTLGKEGSMLGAKSTRAQEAVSRLGAEGELIHRGRAGGREG